ncbi:MAG: bifunctional lysylphosphatidylglycerol flippase/synthetase MprF, partial [Syntrophobacteraceae bacterium]
MVKATQRLGAIFGPLLGFFLFCLALWVLHHELEQFRYQDIINSLQRVSGKQVVPALVATAANYVVHSWYDTLAFRYIKHSLNYRRIAFTSFIGHAISNSIGFPMLAGSSVRYRLYASWGLTTLKISKIIVFCTLTLWLGLLATGGIVFLLEPSKLPLWLHLPFRSTLPIGSVFIAVLGMYLWGTGTRKAPLTFRGWKFYPPPLWLSMSQIAISSLDWALAGYVLYVLLPASRQLTFPAFLGIFLLAQIAGLASQIPGGLGVFESILVLGLSSVLPAYSIIGALLVYRLIYYLLPLVLATALLGAFETIKRKAILKRIAFGFAERAPDIAPRILAFMVFAGGALLLLSGAIPTAGWRIRWLQDILPLPVLEISHFMASLIGIALILLARGLLLRFDAAFLLTTVLLCAGITTSILRGVDFMEAILLGVVLALLVPSRKYFYRKGSLLGEGFTVKWLLSILFVLAASLWLMFFAYRHVQYTNELWWTFTFSGNAPRSLRATVGAAAIGLFIALARLLRSATPSFQPSAAQWDTVRQIVAASPIASANLALLGDKLFLVNESKRSFLMYGIQGRSWVAMGDPIGPEDEHAELVWRFRELCDRYGGWTVFYEVGAANLSVYLDVGLTLFKIGEQARVALEDFSLDGKARQGFRRVCNRVEGAEFSFEVIPADGITPWLPNLGEISQEWL